LVGARLLLTAIRDDSVENDRFEPGTVQDSLFDGVHTLLANKMRMSEQITPLALMRIITFILNASMFEFILLIRKQVAANGLKYKAEASKTTGFW
jgi:hypothetical protein